jgi:very-short-patch-repair endonuclease
VVGIRSEKRNDSPPLGRGRDRGQRIARLAGRQHGVIARTQLFRIGLDRGALARRVANGALQPLHGGRVYAVAHNPLTKRGRYLAAVMACGSDARLSHRAAADLSGMRPADVSPEVTVPEVCRDVPGVRIHRTRMLDPRDFTELDGIPVTTVARTLLDLAAVLTPPDLEVVIDRAERQSLFDLTAVLDVLERGTRKKGAGTLRMVMAAYQASTQKSTLERTFKALLKTAPDITSPFFNALVQGESGTHEVDAFWEAQRLCVQLDGHEFHRTRRDRERDALSDADLELAAYRMMRLTWDDVNVNGERTLRRLRLALGLA